MSVSSWAVRCWHRDLWLSSSALRACKHVESQPVSLGAQLAGHRQQSEFKTSDPRDSVSPKMSTMRPIKAHKAVTR